MRKLIAIAAAAALFALPAYAAPVYVPGQQGAVGPNDPATNSDGVTLRVIQPSVTLNDATGAAVGTSGNPLFTTPASGGATSTVKIDQTTPGTTNGVQVNAALPAGSNLLGKVGIDQTTPGTTNNVTTDGVVDGATQSASVTSATTLLTLNTTGYASVSWQFTSVGAGNTVTFEASNDGANWVAVSASVANSSFALSSTYATGNGTGFAFLNATGYAQVRARVSTYGSGTVSVVAALKRTGFVVTPVLAANGNGIVVQGSAGGNSAGFFPKESATQVTAASGNVANASAVATLAGVSGKTTYIRGFKCQAAGSTAASVVSITIAGTITGTLTYTFVFPAGATTAATPIGEDFSAFGIAASAVNTAITVTLPAGGAGNTNASCVAYGYQL